MSPSSCGKVETERLLRCLLNLTRTEYRVLTALMKQEMDAKSLAALLDLDRSTVQKALMSLVERGLVRRRKVGLPRGGYKFLYRSLSPEEMKSLLNDAIRRWCESLSRELSVKIIF